MSFLISVTLGLILDLEKSSLISFWHQDEFFTYMAKLLFSISTGFVEEMMTVALLISLAAKPRAVSRAHAP